MMSAVTTLCIDAFFFPVTTTRCESTIRKQRADNNQAAGVPGISLANPINDNMLETNTQQRISTSHHDKKRMRSNRVCAYLVNPDTNAAGRNSGRATACIAEKTLQHAKCNIRG